MFRLESSAQFLSKCIYLCLNVCGMFRPNIKNVCLFSWASSRFWDFILICFVFGFLFNVVAARFSSWAAVSGCKRNFILVLTGLFVYAIYCVFSVFPDICAAHHTLAAGLNLDVAQECRLILSYLLYGSDFMESRTWFTLVCYVILCFLSPSSCFCLESWWST